MVIKNKFKITYFKNLYDNCPKEIEFKSWNHFVKFLYNLSKRELNEKKDAEVISPAIYNPHATRNNDSVLAWAGWAAVDVDDYKNDLDFKKFSDVEYIVYSTASSKKEHPKFRIVFQLDRYVKSHEIRNFWFALQTLVDGEGDTQCKDLSRIYYIPATYKNAYNFFYRNKGLPLKVNQLMSEYSFIEPKKNLIESLPKEYQEKVSSYIKEQLDANYKWSSYKNCPFVNKSIIKEYEKIAFSDGTGRYVYFYKIMVSIALSANKKNYPLSINELVSLMREIDMDNSNIYQKRKLETEAKRAIEYARFK